MREDRILINRKTIWKMVTLYPQCSITDHWLKTTKKKETNKLKKQPQRKWTTVTTIETTSEWTNLSKTPKQIWKRRKWECENKEEERWRSNYSSIVGTKWNLTTCAYMCVICSIYMYKILYLYITLWNMHIDSQLIFLFCLHIQYGTRKEKKIIIRNEWNKRNEERI